MHPPDKSCACVSPTFVVHTCIGVRKEDDCGQRAHDIPERPVEATDVVGDPGRQHQGEEGVGQSQVQQVDGSGVTLLLTATDHVEHQAVATGTDEEHQQVDDGEENRGNSLAGENITGALVGTRRD